MKVGWRNSKQHVVINCNKCRSETSLQKKSKSSNIFEYKFNFLNLPWKYCRVNQNPFYPEKWQLWGEAVRISWEDPVSCAVTPSALLFISERHEDSLTPQYYLKNLLHLNVNSFLHVDVVCFMPIVMQTFVSVTSKMEFSLIFFVSHYTSIFLHEKKWNETSGNKRKWSGMQKKLNEKIWKEMKGNLKKWNLEIWCPFIKWKFISWNKMKNQIIKLD